MTTPSRSRKLLKRMTLEEKVEMLDGAGMWRTRASYRLNVRELVMADGIHGVRYSPHDVAADLGRLDDVTSFIDFVLGGAEGAGRGTDWRQPTTCFPSASCAASSWDRDLLKEIGHALGLECCELGVDILLGPAANIRRSSHSGRAYEYFSEDPLLTGELAAAMVEGIQGAGIAACVKHFPASSSEIERSSLDTRASEKTLREVYLASFERLVRTASPWSLMTSYGRINGGRVCESEKLLSTVLRDEWGFEGPVISDWFGIADRAAALNAGTDLEMPENATHRADLLRALEVGTVDPSKLDDACLRVLRLHDQLDAHQHCREKSQEPIWIGHHLLSRRAASESIVLLRNEAALPIRPERTKRLLVVGHIAQTPIIQGRGSATVRPTQVDEPLEAIRRIADTMEIRFHPGIQEGRDHLAQMAEVAALASDADAVLLFAGMESPVDTEGADRTSLHLEPSDEQMIVALGALPAPLIVTICAPDIIVMPWANMADAILFCFFPGQGFGAAISEILFGRRSPEGKLTITVPQREKDLPYFLDYPPEQGMIYHSEGCYIGYRHYEARAIEPQFCFGHGLSYTHFRYDDFVSSGTLLHEGQSLKLAFNLANVGDMDGAEIVQMYLTRQSPNGRPSVRVLHEFRKLRLLKNASQSVSMTIRSDDLRFYNEVSQEWQPAGGRYRVDIGASFSDIRLSGVFDFEPRCTSTEPFDINARPDRFIADKLAYPQLRAFLAKRFRLDDSHLDVFIDLMRSSHVGLWQTLDALANTVITRSDVEDLVEQIEGARTSRARSRQKHDRKSIG